MSESLKRLKRDSVDLLQLHNPIDASNVEQVLGGALEGLERMRAQKLARFIGLTALGEAPAIVRALDSGRFDSAQVYYNLLNPSAARAMPKGWTGHDFSGVCAACKRHDVAMMNIRVFASGVLATDERHGREVVVTRDSDLDVEAQRAPDGAGRPRRRPRHARADRAALLARQPGPRLHRDRPGRAVAPRGGDRRRSPRAAAGGGDREARSGVRQRIPIGGER
jgi:aryl-alcohol dehydrogenase-like predicted oxidoreductase